jgi:hypothetical protein
MAPTIYQLVHDAVVVGPDAPSELDFTTFYASQDEAVVRLAARQRVHWERWDQTSSVSGIPAEEVKQRPDYTGGECYLVYIDGQLTYFQPHGMGEGVDPISEEDLSAVAQAHVEVIIESLTVSMLIERIRAQHEQVQEFATRQEFANRQGLESSGVFDSTDTTRRRGSLA